MREADNRPLLIALAIVGFDLPAALAAWPRVSHGSARATFDSSGSAGGSDRVLALIAGRGLPARSP